ncbi:hypothetical protein [Polaromonas sp.]|uniref:hypothetical protein n=1 Tax=Polaromonas sp. TaxID=1869339 RepID=UPI0013BDEB20|nr:hypothetical protein [Polaromonas sp.]NDP64637.1 hypothetical protein [Polaromonas sp.]
MSDGPHRSLQMRKLWKVLAMRADQSAYAAEEVAEAVTNALIGDFKNEVKFSLLSALKAIFTGLNNSLESPEIALQELADAKSLAAGSVFGMNAVEWSIELIRNGKFGLDAFYDAVGLAAKMRGYANIRSAEEHYVRKSTLERAVHLKQRLTSAVSGLSEGLLGSILVGSEFASAQRSRKKTHLDEGVQLS